MTVTSARALAHVSKTILLVGAGKMGGALLEGWLGLGLDPRNAVVLEPQPARELTALASRGLRLNPAASAIGEASAIIIAVKPQMAAEVMPTLASYVGAGTVVVSIMAGRTLGFLEQTLSHGAALVRAIRSVHDGNVLLAPEAVVSLVRGSRADTLTAREREVLAGIADGKSNREIARLLRVSEKTVKAHVSAVLAKLGVQDRTQAAVYAVRHGTA